MNSLPTTTGKFMDWKCLRFSQRGTPSIADEIFVINEQPLCPWRVWSINFRMNLWKNSLSFEKCRHLKYSGECFDEEFYLGNVVTERFLNTAKCSALITSQLLTQHRELWISPVRFIEEAKIYVGKMVKIYSSDWLKLVKYNLCAQSLRYVY